MSIINHFNPVFLLSFVILTEPDYAPTSMFIETTPSNSTSDRPGKLAGRRGGRNWPLVPSSSAQGTAPCPQGRECVVKNHLSSEARPHPPIGPGPDPTEPDVLNLIRVGSRRRCQCDKGRDISTQLM